MFLKLRKVAWRFYDQKSRCYLGQLKIEIAKFCNGPSIISKQNNLVVLFFFKVVRYKGGDAKLCVTAFKQYCKQISQGIFWRSRSFYRIQVKHWPSARLQCIDGRMEGQTDLKSEIVIYIFLRKQFWVIPDYQRCSVHTTLFL